MTEQQQQKKKTKKHTIKRILFIAIFLVIAVFIYCFFCYIRQSQSADEELAAIMAARAIPDSQNAAIIYSQLLEDYNEGKIAFYFPDPDPDSEYLTRIKPWSRDDYPELADWLENQQALIEKLLEASKLEKCFFPINTDLEGQGDNIDRLAPMRQWAFLLIRAANHDIAQGKSDLALEKYISVIQIGRHECQQPLAIDYIVGIAIEKIALRAIAGFIIEDNPSEPLLSKIEAIQLPTKDRWAKESESMLEVEKLIKQKWKRKFGLFDRLRVWWMFRSVYKEYKSILKDTRRLSYLRLLARRRGNRILITMRRYKSKHGTWPKSLDSIKSFVPAEILVDPINNKSFIYKLTNDSFTLYSKGENGIDDGGKRDTFNEEKKAADDWRIWPAYVIKDKKQMENTNDK
ncbi:MAG: hypothetical protein GY774_15175 [Planctomycetes bacterium]|nr:hypothetical protein [Planctomycetota bacterium]